MTLVAIGALLYNHQLEHQWTDGQFRLVILYYDYLVTLPVEIQYIWPKLFSKSSIWFFINRYIPIFGNIPILLSSFASATAREQVRGSRLILVDSLSTLPFHWKEVP